MSGSYIVFLPDRFDTDLFVLLRSIPDAALFAVPSLALALVWGPIRTVALAAIFVRCSQPTPERPDVGVPVPEPAASG